MTRNVFIHTLYRTGAMAMALLAIMALMACPGKHKSNYDDEEEEEEEREEVRGHSALSNIDDDVLNSFDPNTPWEQHGHSQPFKIHPCDGVYISADAGAFEQDVHITVKDLPMSQLNQLDKELQRDSIGILLAAWDISAGLPHDSIIPGKYTVSFDLDELDIPEETAPYLRICRHRADGSRQVMNTRIVNGSIVCEANQNSIFEIIFVVGYVAYFAVHYPEINQWAREFYDAGIWPWNYWKGRDGVIFHEQDEFGSFDICFRYSMTEYGNQTREYLKKRQELEERVHMAEKEAYKILYERWPEHRAGIFETPQELRLHNTYYVQALTIAMADDDRLMELAKDPMLKPQSVQDIITGLKMALRYIRTELKMKPLSEQFTVYLSPSVDAFGQEAFRVKVPMIAPYVMVNYENFAKPGQAYTRDVKTDCIMVTLTHETMHVYQTDYIKCSLLKDSRYFEAMGSWVEHEYAKWLWKQGYIDYDPYTNLTMKTGFSGREHKELLAHPLNSFYKASFGMGIIDTNTEGGYMLGDLLQWMQDHKGKRNGDQMMTGYAFNKGFAKSVMDVWSLNEDQFAECFKGFCQTHMKEIASQQASFSKDRRNTTDPIILDVTHSPGNPIMHMEDFCYRFVAKPWTIHTIHIIGDSSALVKPYSLFATDGLYLTASRSLRDDMFLFTFTEGDSLYFTDDPMTVYPCKNKQFVKDAYAALITLKDEGIFSGAFDIVALYQPIRTPEVKGRSRDGTGLLVKVNEKPTEILVEKGLVTGLQVGVKNNKTEQVKLYRIKVDDWKEQFVMPYNQIGVTDPNDIDLILQMRWYYETPTGKRFYSPAGEKVSYEYWKSHEEEREEQHEERTDTTAIVTGGNDEEGNDDMGGLVINNAKVRIIDGNISGPSLGYDETDTPYYGTFTLKDGKYKLEIPAHTVYTKMSANTRHKTELCAITIEGKCDVAQQGTETIVSFHLEDNKITANGSIREESIDQNGQVTYTDTYSDITPLAQDVVDLAKLKLWRAARKSSEFIIRAEFNAKLNTKWADTGRSSEKSKDTYYRIELEFVDYPE